MSLQCPNSPITYHTSAQQKLQSKNAAKLYRFGSPKLRDLLREKCRIRVREARQCSFEKSRCLEGKFNLILRQELAELEQDINLQEEIYKELVDEMNEWFVEQMQQEDMYLIDSAESDALLCPVCQVLNLQQPERVADALLYNCACGAKFSYFGDKNKLRSALRAKIDKHEQNCVQRLTFFVEPQVPRGDYVLNALCEKCDYFCSL